MKGIKEYEKSKVGALDNCVERVTERLSKAQARNNVRVY